MIAAAVALLRAVFMPFSSCNHVLLAQDTDGSMHVLPLLEIVV